MWQLWLFGLGTVPVGFYLWHRQGPHFGLGAEDIELQVLRGLGDDIGRALAATGLRVRVYCPVGDLVQGMAYLVRRILENTANDSFLRARARGADLEQLLARP